MGPQLAVQVMIVTKRELALLSCIFILHVTNSSSQGTEVVNVYYAEMAMYRISLTL
jgi:hypothetical protein